MTTASLATATAVGANVIAGASSDEEIYNLAADVGDSWQLVLNNKTNTYVVKILASQYGLSTTAAAPFVKSTVGSFTTITALSGSALVLRIDMRTKTVAGNITVGGKAATVSGTGYVVADVGKLAGDYFFAGSARNASNGQFRDTIEGGFIISANGTDITVCDGSLAVNGVCTAVVPGRPVNTKSLKIVKDGATLRIKDGTKDFGILNISAGDRGPVLIVDRFGINDEGILRTGVFYGVKVSKLAGTEFDGNFICGSGGVDGGTVVVSGTGYTVTSQNMSQQGTLQYNKGYVGFNNSVVDVNSIIFVRNNNDTLAGAALVLPLSSSLAVLVNRPTADSTQFGTDKNLNVCRKV